MALSGFAWYQGEADTKDEASAKTYACSFPALIQGWRAAFDDPNEGSAMGSDKYFGFVQLSTWCALPAESLAQMRQAQLAALALPRVAVATNADHGDGCYIHPHNKRPCGTRLGDTALHLVYGGESQKSPTYLSASGSASGGSTVVTVQLSDAGLLELRPPANMRPDGGNNTVDCAVENAKVPNTCAWGAVELAGHGWLNATTVGVQGNTMKLTVAGIGSVVATAYGWGAIPMMSVYDSVTSLPVLPWNSSWNSSVG